MYVENSAKVASPVEMIELLSSHLPAEKSDLSTRIQHFCAGDDNVTFKQEELLVLQDMVNAFKAHKIDQEKILRLQNEVDTLFKGELNECAPEYFHCDIIENVAPYLPPQDLASFAEITMEVHATVQPKVNKEREKKELAAAINNASRHYASLDDLQADLALVGMKVTRLNLPNMISMSVFTSQNQIIHLMEQCPNLTHLNLRGCTPVTAKLAYLIIFELCPNLQELNIVDCPNYEPTSDELEKSGKKALEQLKNFAYTRTFHGDGNIPFWGYRGIG